MDNNFRTVAILGASANRKKFGNKSVRAHLKRGYDVFPINPQGGEIEGLKVWPTIGEVPVAKLDRVSVYLPPGVAATLVEEIAAKGCGEVWLNPGSQSDEFVARAAEFGLKVIQACSIVDIGCSPAEFTDLPSTDA